MREQLNRRIEESEYVTGVAKEARMNTQSAFLTFVEVLNALAILEEENYQKLKQNLNAVLNRYLAKVRQRTKKKEVEV